MSLLFVLVKGGVANQIMLGFLDLDLVTILIAYLFVNYGKTGAGFFAISQGFLIDLFSADPLGLFILLYLAIFFGFNLGCSFFDLKSPRSLLILVSFVVFLKEVLLLGLLKTFSLEIFISSTIILSSILSALLSGIIAPVLFAFFDYVDRYLKESAQETP